MSAHSQHMKFPDMQFIDDITGRAKGAQLMLSLSMSVPSVTNSKDLKEGDLLVLPFDGGCKDILI